jgi:hypothetical protein
MTRIRRGLLLALATTVLAGGVGSAASASFLDTAPVTADDGAPRFSVKTMDVDAPDILTSGLDCTRKDATMSVTWSKSTTPRVTGYVVTVYFSDGLVQKEPMLAAGATSWSKGITLFNATKYALRYTVTAYTDYNWLKESTSTGWYQC